MLPTFVANAAKRKKPILFLLGLFVLIICLALFLLKRPTGSSKNTAYNPIPISIRRSVVFDIYYPRQEKLPQGYYFDTGSIRVSSSAVIYIVNHESSQLIFSLQSKPPDLYIQRFYSSNMPLHNNESTYIGIAAIGAIRSQTIVSIPTYGNTWILITAPQDVNQTDLKAVLYSLTSSN